MIDINNTTENENKDSSQAAEASGKNRKHRVKIEELEQQIVNLKAEIEAEREKRLRLAAEYDNYRRRTQQEFRQLYETAGERVLLKLLPIVDDFDRLMAHSESDTTALRQGFEMIHRKLQGLLEAEGVAPISALGISFDSDLHEAVAQVPSLDAEHGTIIAEVERGYRLRDKIIRHAKVVIAQAAEEAADKTTGGDNG